MMNVLLINGAQPLGRSKGDLNKTLMEAAGQRLAGRGHSIQTSTPNAGFTPEAEIEKYLWANVVVYHFPIYWMGVPAMFKKYVDEVFVVSRGKLYDGDGRDQGKDYGQGGLLHGKKYMVVTTWNAPASAFMTKGQFFEGKSADDVLYPFHQSQRFLGLEPLPSFHLFDVMRKPRVEAYLSEFKAHLDNVF